MDLTPRAPINQLCSTAATRGFATGCANSKSANYALHTGVHQQQSCRFGRVGLRTMRHHSRDGRCQSDAEQEFPCCLEHPLRRPGPRRQIYHGRWGTGGANGGHSKEGGVYFTIFIYLIILS